MLAAQRARRLWRRRVASVSVAVTRAWDSDVGGTALNRRCRLARGSSACYRPPRSGLASRTYYFGCSCRADLSVSTSRTVGGARLCPAGRAKAKSSMAVSLLLRIVCARRRPLLGSSARQRSEQRFFGCGRKAVSGSDLAALLSGHCRAVLLPGARVAAGVAGPAALPGCRGLVAAELALLSVLSWFGGQKRTALVERARWRYGVESASR